MTMLKKATRDRLTKKGRQSISKAAKLRWRKFREAKRRGDKRAARKHRGY